jgi:hypothetical protein
MNRTLRLSVRGRGYRSVMVYIVIVFMVVVAAVSIYRMRRGGPGPAVNYVPRRLRGRLNSAYRHEGWQEPFDEQGNRSPDRSQL